ncbi:MAG: ParB N-terminal domain-containing protein, partial [Anaerolineae bacterium]|nr:ParB N-terminal domain-containing protein [Anaerolineae bacterium]NIQ77024.1 ParB N-terminal domain-containing protein [Anaerolineae bacterium]
MAKKKKNKKKINASKSNIRTFVQTITESWAIRKLEEAKTEVQNRNVSDKHVDFLVREIKEGRWVENGVPIILDEDGFLVDGQHRLWAIIKSGQPVRALIVQGVDRDDALPTIDLNRRSRNFADVLVMKNIIDKPVPQPRVVQAATKWLHKYRKRLIFQSAGKVSAGELEETLIKEPGLIEGLHAA